MILYFANLHLQKGHLIRERANYFLIFYEQAKQTTWQFVQIIIGLAFYRSYLFQQI